MSDQRLFLTTLGREFGSVVADLGIEASGQDAYEVFSSGLKSAVDFDALSNATISDIESIKASCDAYFERGDVTESHIRAVIERTLTHWA